MKRIFAAALILASLTAMPAFADTADEKTEKVMAAPIKNVAAKDEKAVADAAALSSALTDVTAKVMECTKADPAPATCQCKFPVDLGNIRTQYDAALKAHPDWKDAMVTFKEEGKTETTVSFAGVAKQLEVCK